jgi:hypothetical protein
VVLVGIWIEDFGMKESTSSSSSFDEPYPLSCLLADFELFELWVDNAEFARFNSGFPPRILAKALLIDRVMPGRLSVPGFAYFRLEWQTSRPDDRS